MAQNRTTLTHEALLLKNYLGNGSTAVVRHSVLQIFGLFDEDLRRLVDHELWVRLTFHGQRFQQISQPLTEYRIHAGSFTADTDRMLLGLEEFLKKVATYTPESVQRLAPLARACNHRWMARAAFVAGNYSKARYHIRMAWCNAPQVLWHDPRAPITFAAIGLETITPEPLFRWLQQLGYQLTRYWLSRNTTALN